MAESSVARITSDAADNLEYLVEAVRGAGKTVQDAIEKERLKLVGSILGPDGLGLESHFSTLRMAEGLERSGTYNGTMTYTFFEDEKTQNLLRITLGDAPSGYRFPFSRVQLLERRRESGKVTYFAGDSDSEKKEKSVILLKKKLHSYTQEELSSVGSPDVSWYVFADFLYFVNDASTRVLSQCTQSQVDAFAKNIRELKKDFLVGRA